MNTTATLKVENGRKEVDVNDRNRGIYECLVPVEQLGRLDVTQIPWANIRIGYNAEFKSPVVTDIRTSLYAKDGAFHTKHKGIRIIVDNATLDDGKLYLNFGSQARIGNDNDNVRGLGDGGTTVRTIVEALKDPDEPFVQGEGKQYVRLYVHYGNFTKGEVSELVESWNTGLNANIRDLMQYRQKFDKIQKLLEKKPFGEVLPASGIKSFPEVSYFSGDPGQYDITEIVQFLCIFAMDNANRAYAGTGGCLSYFDGSNPKLTAVIPFVFDIVYLYETMAFRIQDLYNALGKKGDGGKFLATRPVIKGQSKKPVTLPFTGKQILFTPHKAWALPMLAAFRGAMEFNEDGTAQWVVDPVKLLEEVGGELYQTILKCADKDTDFNLTALGRDPMLYEALELKVRGAAYKAARKGKYAIAGQ